MLLVIDLPICVDERRGPKRSSWADDYEPSRKEGSDRFGPHLQLVADRLLPTTWNIIDGLPTYTAQSRQCHERHDAQQKVKVREGLACDCVLHLHPFAIVFKSIPSVLTRVCSIIFCSPRCNLQW